MVFSLRPVAEVVVHLIAPCQNRRGGGEGARRWRAGSEAWLCEGMTADAVWNVKADDGLPSLMSAVSALDLEGM